MNNPHDLHSWSTQYREERLAEARKRDLVRRARADRQPRGLQRVGLTRQGVLAQPIHDFVAEDGSERKGGETMAQAMTKRIRPKALAALFVALVVFGGPTVEAASAAIPVCNAYAPYKGCGH